MRKLLALTLIGFITVAALAAQSPQGKSLFVHAAGGIGDGMYVAAGGEYMLNRFTENLPFTVQFGGKGQGVYSPNSSGDNSFLGIGLMPTFRYGFDAVPGLEVFGGVGFGFILYLETTTSYDTTIDFYTELGASYALSESLSAFAGLGAYWGDLVCFMAGVRLGL